MEQKTISGKKFISYPLYVFYKDSSLGLNQIMTHYNQRFYLIEYDVEKSQKVLDVVFTLKSFSKLSYRSTQLKLPLTCNEIMACINSSFWFKFQSNKTKVLGVLIAASLWEEKVNSVISIIDSTKFRNDILTVFDKLNIIADLTEEEYLKDTIPGKKEKEKIEAKRVFEKKKAEEMSSFTHSWELSEYCNKNSIFDIELTEIEGKTVFSLTSIGGSVGYAIPAINLSFDKKRDICGASHTREMKKIYGEELWEKLHNKDTPIVIGTLNELALRFIRIGLLDNPKDSVIRYIIYDDEETRNKWEKIGLPYGLL